MAKLKAVAAAPALQGDIPGRLAGKIAVVTGAAGNLGGHIVTHYLAEGATVVMTGRTPDRTKAAAEALLHRVYRQQPRHAHLHVVEAKHHLQIVLHHKQH